MMMPGRDHTGFVNTISVGNSILGFFFLLN
jgi:hypothetical protein